MKARGILIVGLFLLLFAVSPLPAQEPVYWGVLYRSSWKKNLKILM